MLDYNALKPTDLSRLVDARIGNPDASGVNLTHIVPAKNLTWAYPIFTLDGDYGFAAASAVVGWHGAYWNGLNIVSGKKYKIKFSAVLNSGATPLAQISTGPVGSSGQLPYTHAITNGVNEYVVTATLTSSNAVVTIDANGVTSFSISGFEIQEWSGEELEKTGWSTYSGGTVTGDRESGYTLTCDGSAWSGMITDDNIITSATEKFYLSITIKRTSGDAGEILYFGSSQVSEAFQIIPTTEYITFTSESISFPTIGKFFLIGNTNSGVYAISQISAMKVTGLVAAWNMIPSPDGVLVDISGEGNNGTIVGAVSSKDGMKFNGSSDYIDVGSSAISTGTIAIRFKNNNIVANKMLLARNSGFFIYLLNTTVMRLRVNGVVLDFTIAGYTAGNWADVVFTIVNIVTDQIVRCFVDGVESSSGALSPSDGTPFQYQYFGYGAFAGSYFEGETEDCKIFNYAFSEAEAVAYHNSFQKINQKHNFDDAGVGSTI